MKRKPLYISIAILGLATVIFASRNIRDSVVSDSSFPDLILEGLDDQPIFRAISAPSISRKRRVTHRSLSVIEPFDLPRIGRKEEGLVITDTTTGHVVIILDQFPDIREQLGPALENVGELFESNCELFRRLFSITKSYPGIESLRGPPHTVGEMLLRLKNRLYRPRSRTGLFASSSGNFCAFQIGDPGKSDQVEVHVYTPKRLVAFLRFSRPRPEAPRIEQQLIDDVVASLERSDLQNE